MEIAKLLEALEITLEYERTGQHLSSYINKMNILLSPSKPYQHCGHCSALMKRYHSDFQRIIWTKLLEIGSEYVPPLPKFSTPRLNLPYQQKNLRLVSLADLLATQKALTNDSVKLKRRKMNLDAQNCLKDAESLKEYRLLKLNYFEDYLPTVKTYEYVEMSTRNFEKKQEIIEKGEVKLKNTVQNAKIDKELLRVMKDDGKSHAECAQFFGVSKSGISQMLKSMNYKKKTRKNGK